MVLGKVVVVVVIMVIMIVRAAASRLPFSGAGKRRGGTRNSNIAWSFFAVIHGQLLLAFPASRLTFFTLAGRLTVTAITVVVAAGVAL